MNGDSVSIVIPCYSWPDLLPKAIESIEDQTISPGAIICVLDGPPEPDRYIQYLHSHSDIVQILLPQNQGVSTARNTGLNYADRVGYEWFVLFDEDDLLYPRFLEEMLLSSQSHPDCAIHYCEWMMFGDWDGHAGVPEYSYERLLQSPYILNTSLIKMEVWRDVRDKNGHGYDPDLVGWEDYCFYLEGGALGHHGVKVGQPLVKYRKHSRSISTVANEQLPRIVQHIRKKLKRLYGVELLCKV